MQFLHTICVLEKKLTSYANKNLCDYVSSAKKVQTKYSFYDMHENKQTNK